MQLSSTIPRDPIQLLRTRLVDTTRKLLNFYTLADDVPIPKDLVETYKSVSKDFNIPESDFRNYVPHLLWAIEDVIFMLDHVETKLGEASIELEMPLPKIKTRHHLLESLQLVKDKLSSKNSYEEKQWKKMIFDAYSSHKSGDLLKHFNDELNRTTKALSIINDSHTFLPSPVFSKKNFFNLPSQIEDFLINDSSHLKSPKVYALVNEISQTPTPMRKGIANALEDIFANHLLYTLGKIERNSNRFKNRNP